MTTPRFRSALDSIPAYKAGKPPSGDAATSYKLSSNENPFAPLPGVLERVAEAAASMNRYPDMGVVALHDALAARYRLDPSQVATGTGSVACLYQLLQASCEAGDEVVYAWRSFEAYPIAVGLTGARSVQVPVDADARHDLAALAAAVTDKTKVVIVCTPNNPTGPSVHEDELADLIAAVPPHVLVAIDEAYHEFVTDPETPDALESTRGLDNVVVLRTFSKAYGLAGLRVGYALGPPPVIEAVRKCALPFGVSHVAQAAALASLDAETEMRERVASVVAERTRILDALRMQGWTVPDAQGNFFWLPLGDDSVRFAEVCESSGLSVRPFPGDGVRITVGEPEANDLLLTVTEKWISAANAD